MPLPRQAWPRIVVSPQVRPNGPGDALPVQIGRDGARRFPRRKLPEDTADNRARGLIDLAFAPNRFTFAIGALYHVVAIAEPAAGLTLLHPPAQTSMSLG